LKDKSSKKKIVSPASRYNDSMKTIREATPCEECGSKVVADGVKFSFPPRHNFHCTGCGKTSYSDPMKGDKNYAEL